MSPRRTVKAPVVPANAELVFWHGASRDRAYQARGDGVRVTIPVPSDVNGSITGRVVRVGSTREDGTFVWILPEAQVALLRERDQGREAAELQAEWSGDVELSRRSLLGVLLHGLAIDHTLTPARAILDAQRSVLEGLDDAAGETAATVTVPRASLDGVTRGLDVLAELLRRGVR